MSDYKIITYTFKPPSGKEVKFYSLNISRYLYKKYDRDVGGIEVSEGKLTFKCSSITPDSFTLDFCEFDTSKPGIPDIIGYYQITFNLERKE